MELKRYWRILWKRRSWVVAMFALVLALTGYWTFTMQPVYEASSKILLIAKDRTLSAFGREMDDLGKLSGLTIQSSPLETQAEVLRSAPIVSRVIEKAELQDAATGEPMSVEAFRGLSRVLAVKGTDILRISFEDPDPARAQKVVETWAQVFIEDNQAANREQAANSAKFLGGQLTKNRKELAEAEAALRDFRQKNIAVDLSEQARASIQGAADLDDQIRQATASYVEANTRVAALRRQIGLSSSQAMAATALGQDPNVQRLRARLVDAETSLSNVGLAADHPEVKRKREEIALLRRQLAKQAASLVGRNYAASGVGLNLDPVRQSLTTELVQTEISALGYATRLESLKSLSGMYNGRLSALPSKQMQLTRLERRVTVASELQRLLSQKYQEAKIQAEVSSGNVRQVEAAGLPAAPIKPKKLLNMAIATLVGLGLGLGGAVFREYLEDTIQTVEDAEKAIGLPVLGIIPWQRRSDHARLVTLREPRAPVSEAYRTMRTNLKFMATDDFRALTITSAGAGEGKSTTIANLAITFAQAGRRVLLVDADMRKPSQHVVFELPNASGLAAILAGDAAFEDAVQRSAHPKLDVLTCGPLPPDPAELLDSDRMDALIADLKGRYDLILFDAPPVIAVADASILAAKLDGLVVLLGLNRVTRRAARHAMQRLEAAHVRVWGMVAAGIRSDHDPYYHAYYASYYGAVAQRRGFRIGGFWGGRKAG